MGDQYRDTGWFGLLFTLLMVAFVLLNIARAHGGKELFIRRIAGLNAIDEAVGRATEMGKPVVMVPGLSDTTVNAKSMQAINIFAYVSRVAARFATPILVCCYNSGIYAVSQEIIRDVYQQEGLIDRFDIDSVRFISDRQFAFAAGVSGLIMRERAAACFFMGEFYAESLILAESSNTVGAIQVASSTEITQTPFFIAACDYVLIGDEFYAASAYLTRQPVLVGSLIGQDWCKLALGLFVLIGALFSTYVVHSQTDMHWDKDNHYVSDPAGPRQAKVADGFIAHLLSPKPESDVKVEREKYNPDEIPQADKGGAAQ